ncbi:MAG: hypothetical protein H7Z74_03655 [Anaerolineae bacterium]|nr:hypothetical protein [Gemmatimonadaceae bacterium]
MKAALVVIAEMIEFDRTRIRDWCVTRRAHGDVVNVLHFPEREGLMAKSVLTDFGR